MTKREIAELAASRTVGSCVNPGYSQAQLVKMYLKASTKAAMIRYLLATGALTPADLED